jgi:hypothetical protein
MLAISFTELMLPNIFSVSLCDSKLALARFFYTAFIAVVPLLETLFSPPQLDLRRKVAH